jgi:hypothetical protein
MTDSIPPQYPKNAAVFLMLSPEEVPVLEALVEPETGLTYKDIKSQRDSLPYGAKEEGKKYQKRLDKLLGVMQRKQKEKRGLTLSSNSKYLSKMPSHGDWKSLTNSFPSAILQGGVPVGWMVEHERSAVLRAPGVSYGYGRSVSKEFTAYTLEGKEIGRGSRSTDVLDRVFEYLQKNPVKTARLTTELLQVKYQNLGDFGGTDPVDDMYVLDVSGPTFEYRKILSDLGLRWNPTQKTWGVTATLYRYNNARRNAEWVKNRNIQEKAYPKLQELAKAHNSKARAENEALGPVDYRQRIEEWRRSSRMLPQLEAAGIKVEYKSPGKYELGEPQVWVSGETYDIRALLGKHGFKWNSAKRAWGIPAPEFQVIKDKWMSEVVRGLPRVPAPTVRSVFTDMSDPEINAWIRSNVEAEYITRDGETSMNAGIAAIRMRLRGMSPENQERFYNNTTSAGRRAGVVVPFAPRVPKNTHTILIAGVKYVLSTHWPGVFGDISEESEESEGAQVIRQEDMDPWKYLWVYDTDKQILAMWRASDGNEKEWSSARSATRTILFLEKKGQLNRVDNAQFRRIEAEMSQRARENEAALEKWVDELKDDFQRQVDNLVREYFDKEVRPVMDRAVANVDAGAIPLGFKATEGGFPVDRQMKSFVTSNIYNNLFNLDKIDAYVRSRGVDLESGDPQATQWAQGDVWLEYAKSALR